MCIPAVRPVPVDKPETDITISPDEKEEDPIIEVFDVVDMTGETLEEARDTLKEFSLVIEEEPGDSAEVGTVVSSPPATDNYQKVP